MATHIHLSPKSDCRGAALPIALILLAILMLLAVAGMRSAGMGFIMAGNEQFREKAFIASEVGIEQGMAFGTFNPSVPTFQVVGTVPNAASDAYTTNINRQLNGVPQGAIWGSSWNSFSTFHFEMQSTGTSVRSAQTLHDQGVAIIAPYSSTYTGPGGL
jgi:Tfp pilus assembly protein PilX